MTAVVVYPPVVASDSTTLGVAVLALLVGGGVLLATAGRWLPVLRARRAGRARRAHGGGRRPASADERLHARMRAVARQDRAGLGENAQWALLAAWVVGGAAALVLVIVWVPKVLLELESSIGVSAYEQGDYERAIQIFETHEDRDPARWRAHYDEGTAFLARALAQGEPTSPDFVVWFAEDAESHLDRALWGLTDEPGTMTDTDRCYVVANARTAKLLLADAAEAELARDPEAYFSETPDELRADAADLDDVVCPAPPAR